MSDLTTKTRDQVIAEYQRDYLLRCPTALTGSGTQPYLDATLLADQLMPLYANTVKAARASDLEQMTLEELKVEAARLYVPLTGAVGSSGHVVVTTATGGATIFAGDELVEPSSKARFYCLTTALYLTGDDVPIASRSTGIATNLPAATVLQWSSPRAGCSSTCTVAETSDGEGLTGGAAEEGREQILEKIRDARANPRGSGNDSDYRAWARSTSGVQIQEVFIYPACFGPGTVAWTFTVAPNRYGSRIPSATQIALVRSQVTALAPRSDLGFFVVIQSQPVAICAQVTWAQDADQWADEAPWPAYLPLTGTDSRAVQVSAASSPLSFTLATQNGVYTTCGDPVVGQTLAFWDGVARMFRRKKVLTVGGTGPWVITCDGTFSASDTTYTPVVGQRAMPWSESLGSLVAPAVAHFDGVGPGEAKVPTYLDGLRGRRDPAAPKLWPDRVTKALEAALEGLDVVASLDLVEGGATVAGPNPSPYMLTMSEFAVFAA